MQDIAERLEKLMQEQAEEIDRHAECMHRLTAELEETKKMLLKLSLGSNTKSEKPASQTKDNTWMLTMLEERKLSTEATEAVKDWVRYKKERKEKYTETGYKKLLTMIENKIAEIGESTVIEVINTSMAKGYQGIIFELADRKQNFNRSNPPLETMKSVGSGPSVAEYERQRKLLEMIKNQGGN